MLFVGIFAFSLFSLMVLKLSTKHKIDKKKQTSPNTMLMVIKTAFLNKNTYWSIIYDKQIVKLFCTIMISSFFLSLSTYAIQSYNSAIKKNKLDQFISWYVFYHLQFNGLDYYRSLVENSQIENLMNKLTQSLDKWLNKEIYKISPDYVHRNLVYSFYITYNTAKASVETVIRSTIWIINMCFIVVVYGLYIVYLAPVAGCWLITSSIFFIYFKASSRLVNLNKDMIKHRKKENNFHKNRMNEKDKLPELTRIICPENNNDINDNIILKKQNDLKQSLVYDNINLLWTRSVFFFLFNNALNLNIIITVIIYCYTVKNWNNDIIAILMTSGTLTGTFRRLLSQYNMVMDAFAKWKPFQEDLDKFPKVRRLYNQILPESDCSLFYTFDIKMKAEEPRLAYKSAKTNTDKLPSVYGDIILEQGKRYALCGGTGSGKSSIFSLLSGMFPEQHINQSVVLLNNNIVEGGFYAMTESIYILRQNPSNDFSKSLDNIIRNGAIDDHLSNKEKDELIDEVIRMTCLSDDLINATQKDLWEKPLKNSVSGGQQTRINLANILYILFCLKKTPYLLLLDEPDAGISEGVKLNDFDRKKKNKENMIRNILKNIYNHPKLKNTIIISIVHHYNACKDLFDVVFKLEKEKRQEGRHKLITYYNKNK